MIVSFGALNGEQMQKSWGDDDICVNEHLPMNCGLN
jgi:hypothetical protein